MTLLFFQMQMDLKKKLVCYLDNGTHGTERPTKDTAHGSQSSSLANHEDKQTSHRVSRTLYSRLAGKGTKSVSHPATWPIVKTNKQSLNKRSHF